VHNLGTDDENDPSCIVVMPTVLLAHNCNGRSSHVQPLVGIGSVRTPNPNELAHFRWPLATSCDDQPVKQKAGQLLRVNRLTPGYFPSVKVSDCEQRGSALGSGCEAEKRYREVEKSAVAANAETKNRTIMAAPAIATWSSLLMRLLLQPRKRLVSTSRWPQ
jgi:hypothetical protein